MVYGVGHLPAGRVGDLEFDFKWHLSFNSVRNFFRDFIWLKGRNFIWLLDILSLGNLVWYLGGLNIWDFLCDLVFLSHVFGHIVDMMIIRGVSSLIAFLDLGMVVKWSVVAWLRFNTITRVVGVISFYSSFNWDISNPGLVLCSIKNLFFISILGLIGDDWNFSVLSGGYFSVFNRVDGVISSVSLSSVLSFMLNSVFSVEDSVVSDFFIISVEDLVLVGVSGLWLISVLGDGVRSLEDVDVSSVSVFFFISVENFIVSFIGCEWHISVMCLSVESVFLSWLKSVPCVCVWSIRNFILGCVPLFFVGSVLDLSLVVSGGDWDLSGSDLGLSLGCDAVFDLVIDNFYILELGLCTIFSVYMLIVVFFISILDTNGL